MNRTGATPRASGIAAVACALLLASCVAPPPAAPPAPAVNQALADADAKLASEDYRGAITSYTSFVAAHPEHPEVQRARATQKALEKLVAAQVALSRTQQGSDAARKELADKIAESERLRGEVVKLRADLERLRSIDLPSRSK